MTFRRDQLTRMIRPDSVAVIGASAQRFAAGNEVIANLVEERFPGTLTVVHPSAAQVDGQRTVASIADLPEGLDAALVALPAARVVDVLEQLERRGCNAAIVPSTGFGAYADRFREFTRTSRMAVHGPNNMGIINLVDRIPLWIQHGGPSREPAGNIGLVAQSGSAAIFLPRTARSGLFSRIVSSGSEWQLTAADYIDWLAADDATEGIGLVLESIRDPQRFREAVGTARAAGKPLAVLKVGRTEAGQRATTAHTGALVAADDFYRVLFDELDIPMVADYDELAAVLELFGSSRTRSAAGNRVGATTLSGGQSALVADLAARHGVEMAPLTDESRRRLDELIPGGSSTVPVDIGGGTSEGVSYEAVLDVLLEDPTVDSVLIVADAQDTLSLAELEVERLAWRGVNAVFDRTDKPIVFASSSARSVHPIFAAEVTSAAPTVRGFAQALVALNAITRNRLPIGQAAEVSRDFAPAQDVVARLRAEASAVDGALSRDLSGRILAAYGIAAPPGGYARAGEDPVTAAEGLTYPLVAKVDSAAIPHRTEAGCVITDIADEAELRVAVATILERATAAVGAAQVAGIEIQEQLDRTLEAAVGIISSPVHGSLVVVGAGGTLVELIEDAASAYAPFDLERAKRLIGGTRLSRLLAGYRRIVEPTDDAPLASLVHRVSLLAADFAGVITELDLNPVLIRPGDGRAAIVDSLLIASAHTDPDDPERKTA